MKPYFDDGQIQIYQKRVRTLGHATRKRRRIVGTYG